MLNDVVGAVTLPHPQNFVVYALTILGFEKTDAQATDVPAALAAIPFLEFVRGGSGCVDMMCCPTNTTKADG